VAAGFVGPLPVGVTFLGGRWSEGKLLAYAFDFEQATHARVPPQLIPSIGDAASASKPKPNAAGHRHAGAQAADRRTRMVHLR
jgi:hypothetical protein